ncbi:MAG TPA: hypothetical protein VK249_32135 [Anaerolineales bacterium]|nr:hypothetical protein [Anaerolineales bacterium]
MTQEESPDHKQVHIEIGGISDVTGTVNVAARDIVNIGDHATVIVGAPAEAISGLVALRDLMQRSSDVRTAVIVFRNDFKMVREQVDRLGDLKDLHDLLHRLQFHCYSGIVLARTRFPDDELILNILAEHALTLGGIVDELKQVATRPSLSEQDLSWIDEARLAKEDLQNALDTPDGNSLRMVIWRLNRLLATQPARINILLNQSARALRLPALLSALGLICDSLSALDLDNDKMAAFRSGVEALGQVDRVLSALVEAHDRWQALDSELRRIDGCIDHDLSELELSWRDVKRMAAPLYLDCPDDWAGALKKDSSALDEALNGSNPARVREGFRRYQRRATQRFYQVDIQLKTLSGNLRQIGVPLAAVLELIG